MSKFIFVLFCAVLISPIYGQIKSNVSKYNVVWTTPSKFSYDNMPLGNGKMGVTVSATADGVLHIIPAHVDAWSESMHLLKLGILNVKITPNPFLSDFSQSLDIEKGLIIIKGSNNFIAEMRVDANRSVFVFEAQSDKDFTLETEAEIWRTKDRYDQPNTTLGGMPNGVFQSADILKPDEPNALLWYHRNKPNPHFYETLKLHEVDSMFSSSKDILENLSFGVYVKGEGMSKTGERTLVSTAHKKQSFRIDVLCKRTQTAAQWEDEIKQNAQVKLRSKDKTKHLASWENFWNTSWINVTGDAQAETVSIGYAHVMYLNALAGKGEFPIMWSGSIFTPDPRNFSTHYHGGTVKPQQDIDFRNWDNCLLNQNIRLPYYSMLAAGQFSFTKPYIDMYMRGLPFMREHTQKVFGHEGTFFREGMTLWGISAPGIYGFNREGLPPGEQSNEWHRTHWQGGLETAFFMGEYYVHTMDEDFAKNTFIPFANEVVKFFDVHWPHKDGKLFFPHVYVLETLRDVDNPMPFIAGLHAVIKQLLALPTELTTIEQRQYWKELQSRLPEIPLRKYKGMTLLANGDTVYGEKFNVEVGELYAVFPYHLYGVGLPNLQIAKDTWHNSTVLVTDVGGKNPDWSIGYLRGGWRQEVVMAAIAGMTKEAKEEVSWGLGRIAENLRYPGYFQTTYDWVPDVQHASMNATALQRMLMQEVDGKIILFPSWPKEWNVSFKLHAPYNTTVECVYKNGKVEKLIVTPESNKNSIIISPMTQ